MKLLYYTRPSQHDFYKSVFSNSNIIEHDSISYVTEIYKQYKRLNDPDVFFLDINQNINSHSNYFDENEIQEIIARDRYLRTIKYSKAKKFINNVCKQLLDIYDQINPDIVSSHIVDGFTVDIFHLIAKRKGIKTFSPVWNGFGDTCKFYNHRKIIERPTPIAGISLEKEMQSKRLDISNPNLTNDNIISRVKSYLKYLRSKISHYRSSGFIYGKNSIHLKFRQTGTIAHPKINISDLRENYFHDINSIKLNYDKPIVYVSCHLVPEATLDYFTDDLSLIDHDSIIKELIRQNHSEVQFIVKDHPVMYNKRDLSLYNYIKSFKDVYLVHPSTPYYEVLQKSDYVISWGGSVGFEAPFFDVIPLSIGKPFYHISGYNNYFEDRKDLFENFLTKITSCNIDIDTYAKKLDDRFNYLLFNGIMHQLYGDEPSNIEKLSNSIDYLISEILLKRD